MLDNACGIILLVICYDKFFPGIVKRMQQTEFLFPHAFLRYAFRNLHQIFAPVLLCKEVDTFALMDVGGQRVPHKDEFVVNDVFQITRKINVLRLPDGTKGPILSIKLHRKLQLAAGAHRIAGQTADKTRLFKIVQIFHDRIDRTGQFLLFQPPMYGVGGKRLPGGQYEVRDAPKNRIFANVASDDGIPQRLRIEPAQITKHIGPVDTLQQLWETAVPEIIFHRYFFSQLCGIGAKFLIYERAHTKLDVLSVENLCRFFRQNRRSVSRDEKRNVGKHQDSADRAPIGKILHAVQKHIAFTLFSALFPPASDVAEKALRVAAFVRDRRICEVQIKGFLPLFFQFIPHLFHENRFSRMSYACNHLYAIGIIKRANLLQIAHSLQHNTSLRKHSTENFAQMQIRFSS